MNNLIYDRVLNAITDRRDRKASGKFNCIPWGFKRFEKIIPGLQQKKYYITTANTKVGKTQITDWAFLYVPYYFTKKYPNADIRVKIFYFTLEMSQEEKILQAMSNLLYLEKQSLKRRWSPTKLMSVGDGIMIDPDVYEQLNKYREHFQDFEQTVTYIDTISNPYGIYKFMREFAEANGVQHKKPIITRDSSGNEITVEIDDYYEPYDPHLYTIVIIDHASLISVEKDHPTKFMAIAKLSEYLRIMRNKWGFSPVLVQQQASYQEGAALFKQTKGEPSLDGLADNKATGRDANLILGLYAPSRHNIRFHGNLQPQYDVGRLRDHYRSLSVLGGRDGGAGTQSALFFDGAVNFFTELPPTTDTAMNTWYQWAEVISTQ